MHQFAMLCLLMIVFFSVGCDRNKVFEENRDMPNYVWEADNTLLFETEIKDTDLLYNLLVNIRHSGLYKFSNIWLKVKLRDEDSTHLIDERFEILLAEKSGKWLGDCSGDICDLQATFRAKYQFNEAGTYTIVLQQIMRQEALPAIMSAGFRIEKAEKQSKSDK